ncbi:hypothetical protein EDD22DRAFT_848420 [Suillus occidentalis]|nr:hypothetical protein EDD22DRAFT_848420 [Suillus occidentalis]
MSSVESNNTLSVTEVSLKSTLVWIKIFQSDGQVVVDQAHDIAHLVSQALQQHGRNASVIPPLLLSAAAEVHATMNVGQAPQWEHMTDDDSCMELHPFFAKTKGYVAPPQAEVPTTGPSASLPAPKVMSVPPINSLAVEAAQPRTDKGKQLVWGTQRPREDDSDDESKTQKMTKKRCKLTKRLSKAIVSDADDENGQPGRTIVVKPVAVVPETPAPSKKVKQDNMDDTNDADEDVKMSSVANMEQPEDTDVTIPPPPTPSTAPPMPLIADPTSIVANPTLIIPDPTPLVANPMIHDCVVALAARVSAMELANQGTIARIEAMEHEFDSHISSMQTEFSNVQLSFTATVEVVNGLTNLVERLQQEHTAI